MYIEKVIENIKQKVKIFWALKQTIIHFDRLNYHDNIVDLRNENSEFIDHDLTIEMCTKPCYDINVNDLILNDW